MALRSEHAIIEAGYQVHDVAKSTTTIPLDQIFSTLPTTSAMTKKVEGYHHCDSTSLKLMCGRRQHNVIVLDIY